MSSPSDDALRIPVEIKTDELDEIRELINDISKAESDLREVKGGALPRKGRGTGDTISKSAFTRPGELGRGGIFNEGFEGGALPSKGRDRTSAQPFQRGDNRLKKLEQEVEKQQNFLSGLTGGIGLVTQGADYASTLSRGGIFGAAGKGIGAIAGKVVVPLAIATAVIGIVNTAIDALLKPGGPWDRRFKRVINDEISSATSRAEKAQIAQGLKIVRMTSYSGFRGGSFAGNAQAAGQGEPIYSQNMEGRAKGVFS